NTEIIERTPIGKLEVQLNRMAIADNESYESLPDFSYESKTQIYKNTNGGIIPGRKGKYVKSVRLKTISVEQAAELEQLQRRLQEVCLIYISCIQIQNLLLK